jgi:RNA polymerase sigma-70 factor (ECF subfamily)
MDAPIDIDPMEAERVKLVRFCTAYTRDSHVAEDLAQLALLDAWRHQGALRDTRARESWLLSIARNRCRMWARGQQALGPMQTLDNVDEPADEIDITVDLEQDELALLLDRALALLPAETREVLVRRYIEEAPQAEIARALHLSEGAVEGRLHRGKLALRRVLATELRADAASFGLPGSADSEWTPTPMWCPGCGRRRLDGHLDPAAGVLRLRCSGCEAPYNNYIDSLGWVPQEARTYRPVLSRVLAGIDGMFRLEMIDGRYQCPSCGETVQMRTEGENFLIACPRCHWLDRETWHSVTWSLPEVRAFWREHPRMRFRMPQPIERDGVPAVVTGFESVTAATAIEVVRREDTLQVLHIARIHTR